MFVWTRPLWDRSQIQKPLLTATGSPPHSSWDGPSRCVLMIHRAQQPPPVHALRELSKRNLNRCTPDLRSVIDGTVPHAVVHLTRAIWFNSVTPLNKVGKQQGISRYTVERTTIYIPVVTTVCTPSGLTWRNSAFHHCPFWFNMNKLCIWQLCHLA
jgi:hypothetical protein